MGRVTRKKAAELAESLHIDEDAVLELDQENSTVIDAKLAAEQITSPMDRSPLGEIATNSGDNNSQSDLGAQELRKSTRSKKGGKKGAKSNKDTLSASTATQPELSGMGKAAAETVLQDQSDVIPSPASERAAEELMKDMGICEFDLDHILVMVSQANAGAAGTPAEETASNGNTTTKVKFTSDEPSIIGEESERLVKGVTQPPEVQEVPGLDSPARINPKSPGLQIQMPLEDLAVMTDSATTSMLDAPASPLPTAIPKTIANLRADTPAKRSTSNKENVSPLEDTPSHYDGSDALGPASNVGTPVTIEQRTVPESQDPITALSTHDNKAETTSQAALETQAPQEKPRVKREKVAPVVRGTKASQARISLAQNPELANSRASTIGRPSLSNAGLGRSQSVRTSTATRTRPETTTRRVPSATATTTTATNNTSTKKESPIIPHSKPRPMSMSFPTPPPPPKSTKPPTQSTFTLPGEAVAAKLKAAREARALKEIEDSKKSAFKARPVPAGLARAPSVRQTTASRGRESLMASKDLKEDKVGLSRSTLAGGASRLGSSTATAAAATSKSTITKPSNDLNVKKRVSTTQANTGRPRSSILSASTNTTLAAAAPPSSRNVSTSKKGKEVLNRPQAAQAAEAKMKAEKEAATRKARVEAAERGRVASREWAERQKRAGEVKKAVTAAAAANEHSVVVQAAEGGEVVAVEGFQLKL